MGNAHLTNIQFRMLKINYKLLTSTIIAIASASGILAFQKNYHANNLIADKNVDYQQKEQQLKAEAKLQNNMPAFGFDNLVADWAFLKYIQYFGDTEARDETGYSVITDYFKTIVNKDPRFIQASLNLSASNSMFAGEPKKTVALLEETAESLSPDMPGNSFMVIAYKAVDEILFLGDLKAAQKSYTKAAEWADQKETEASKDVAKRYRDTVKFLATNPDPTITQVAGWSMILRNNSDPKIKNYAITKIESLGGEVTFNANGEPSVKPPEK